MGLDIYVGSLTRYYAGDWELVSQKLAHEMGIPVQVVRQNDPSDAIRDPDQIRPIVIAWRDGLSASLADHGVPPLDWDEGPTAPYFTDKPTWDCYSDLILWAAYNEHRDLCRPIEHIDDWTTDPAYRLASVPGLASRYSDLFDVGLWLPCNPGFVFKAEDVGGTEVCIGSSERLLKQLQELNARTWQMDTELLHRSRNAGVEHDSPMEVGAKFALSVFSELAEVSVRHRLPMCLDW